MIEIKDVQSETALATNGLFDLIDRVQTGVPYNDTSGTLIAAQWVPNTLAASSVVLLAVQGSNVVGYCIGQPCRSYQGLMRDPSEYGVDPDACLYLSEFGVDETCRNEGVGSRLVQALLAKVKGQYDSVLVRTMEKIYGTQSDNPAISFYRKSGFVLVEQDGQTLIERSGRFKERPRVFLRWCEVPV